MAFAGLKHATSVGAEFSCTEVSVVFSGLRALHQVSISLQRGEVLGVIGPNGAGKTTLVNMLSGFASADSGSVHLDDRDVTGLSPERRARLGVARTFQHGRLFLGLTVRENVELGALGVGASARSARRTAARLLDEFTLQRLAETEVGQCSHGEQQQVAVMRAVAASPKFILLDEPAAGLPEQLTDQLSAVIERLSSDGQAGVLVIDHNVEFILKVSDRVVVLDHGELIAQGTPVEIRQDLNVVSAYLGESGVRHDSGAPPPPERAEGAQ